MTRHEQGKLHSCALIGGCRFREKQKPANDPRNRAARERMAATKAWHKEHGIEHDRSGCK